MDWLLGWRAGAGSPVWVLNERHDQDSHDHGREHDPQRQRQALLLEHLRKHNVQILDEPTVTPQGPTKGLTWCYFLSPWGLQMELVSCEAWIGSPMQRGTVQG